MGFTYVRVLVCHPTDWEKQVEVELLVDTGSMLSVVPRQVLEGVGIKPLGKRKLSVFGGQIIERETGTAVVKYEDVFAPAAVAFGEAEDKPILGATALEALGYQVDPVTGKLKYVGILMV